MSSTEPPESNRPPTPESTPAASRSAPDGTTAGHPAEPAVHSAVVGGTTGGADAGVVGSGSAGFGPSADGPSRAGGRRRWHWVLGGVGVVIVALLVGSAVTLGALRHARGHERFAADGPGVEGRAWWSGDQLGERHGGHWGGALGKGAQPGSSMLLGSVTSVSGANLVLSPDAGAAPVTVITTDRTRVAGGQVRGLSDLKAGDRVAVRVAPDHSASGIMLVPATTLGTVTALSGTSVTIMQPDGLPQAVDTSGLPAQPQVGDLVAVTGTASGSTIKAQNLRQLPKTG